MDTLDNDGFVALTKVFTEFRDNFKELTFGPEPPEMMALNPRAFSVTKEIVDITKNPSETAKMLNDLFDASPKAKVFRIDVSPIFEADNGCPATLKGGTITISGTF